jgi:rubrerythrin
MATEHSQRYCPVCRKNVLAIRQDINHIVHLLLTIITCGIWAIFWIGFAVDQTGWPWRCPNCGEKTIKTAKRILGRV